MTCTGSNADEVPAATRDTDYCYNTESLIVISHGITFRVWKCLFQENSIVFQSMFTPSQSAPDGELVDGCFVLRFDDSPKEWRELFRLLYLRSADIKLRHGSRKVDMPFLSAIIRLGHKYELNALCDWAVGYLTTYYTTSFDAWADGDNAIQWQPDPVHAITAINLARLTNTTSVLPTAFYICATLTPEVLLRVPPKDGDGSTEQLTPEDLRLVLELKAHLAAENARTAFLLFQSDQCHAGAPRSWRATICGEVWLRLLEHAPLPKAPHALASERALDSWVANEGSLPVFAPEPARVGSVVFMCGRGWYQPCYLCESCRAHLKKRDRELRREVWRKLPEFLGLTIEDWGKA